MPEVSSGAADKGRVEQADWRGLRRRSHSSSRRPACSAQVGPPSRTEGKHTTSGLDRLYRLEIESHRRFRADGVNAAEAAGVHTSYALQNHDEPLLRTIGVVNPADLVRATEQMTGMGDPRDVQAAYHPIRQLVRVA
jgi:hypothetical protein